MISIKLSPSILLSFWLILGPLSLVAWSLVITESEHANSCMRELENANRTMSKWADNMEQMVNESKLPASIRESVHNEANKILDMIEEFGEQITTRQPDQLAKDLVTIRRRSNRMALDIYLNTFDMRWPQNSLQVGITAERVQQACLDRNTIQALEAAPSPSELMDILLASRSNAAPTSSIKHASKKA